MSPLSSVIATLVLLNNIYIEQLWTADVDAESDQSYENLGQEIYSQVRQMLSSKEWKEMPQKGILKRTHYQETTLRGSIQAEAPPQLLFKELWNNGENTSDWHSDVASVKVLENVSEHGKILHTTVHRQAGGISNIDFVTFSYYVKEESAYYIVFQSIDYEGMSKQEHYIRAEIGVSAMIFAPVDSIPSMTLFTFVMNTNFKLQKNKTTVQYPSFVQAYLSAVADHARTLE